MDSFEIKSEIDYILHFLPMSYICNTVLPATNSFGRKNIQPWNDLELDESLHIIGIFLSMEVYEIHDSRRMYWNQESDGIFPAMNFGKIISRQRFESVVANLQLSWEEDPDQQVLDFLDAVNAQFKSSLTPGSFITLDESMIKSFHHDLKGKIKIIRKPRPIGNEIKNISDAASKIVLHLELYEGRDIMSKKEYVQEYGATTATTFHLTESYHGSGRRVIADSWFGSVKCAVALMKRCLYSIMLVKTAHKDYPRQLMAQSTLEKRTMGSISYREGCSQITGLSISRFERKRFHFNL